MQPNRDGAELSRNGRFQALTKPKGASGKPSIPR